MRRISISGPPSSVTNLRASISSGSSVNIFWTAPWSLDVTGVDHDIWYSVLIQNVTDEDRPTDILCTDCTNITETNYTFTPDHLSPCHVYNFTIITWERGVTFLLLQVVSSRMIGRACVRVLLCIIYRDISAFNHK